MAQPRNLTQVDAMLNLAKLNETDIKKESIILNFIPQIIDSKQVKLLEVSKDMLKYISSGERYGFAEFKHPIPHKNICLI